jgi:carboxyl-terminal processing protease
LPADTATGVVKALLDQHIIFDYITEWVLANPTVDSIETFAFADWNAFVDYARKRNFSYESASERMLKELRATAEKEQFPVAAELQAMEGRIQAEKASALERNKERIVRELEQEIIGRFYFQRGKVRKQLKNDPEVNAAVALLNDQAAYRKMLVN